MSEENVEVVRRIYDAWNAGDLGSESFGPSFELRQTGMLLESATVFRGHDGLLQAVQELFSGLRDLRWAPDDFIAAPGRPGGRSLSVPRQRPQFGGFG
jgi:ketosteroid isomerase-like protein